MKISKDNSIISDTSALYSLVAADDSNHEKALKIISEISAAKKVAIVPCDVFSETLNIIGKKLGRAQQLKASQIILSEGFLVIEENEKIRFNALEKLKKLPGSVSYTDAVVMAFADEYKTKEILGFDEVFSKEGYQLPG